MVEGIECKVSYCQSIVLFTMMIIKQGLKLGYFVKTMTLSFCNLEQVT